MPPESEAHLRVAILGTVLASGRDSDGLVEPPGVRGKGLLVALALTPGVSVSVGGLAEDIWAGTPPRDPRASIQTLVSRLRQVLAPGLIESTATGYLLRVEPREIDLGRAEFLAEEARHHLEHGEAENAASAITQALGLRRSAPGADLGVSEMGELLASRWEGLRVKSHTLRAEARILAGDGPGALSDLDAVDDSGADETILELRMRAHAAAGASHEALRLFARHRRELRDSLGTDPVPRLVELNARLLTAETEHSGNRPHIGLRAAPNELVGRAADLEALSSLLGTGRLITILGPGGLGKTRLAQEAAAAAGRSGPFVVFVELAGVASGEDLGLALASTLGIREAAPLIGSLEAPARLDVRARILGLLAERDTLLVMDNCEHLIEQAARWIADILASCPGVKVLATSRSPLRIAAEQIYALGPLPAETGGAAVELFTARARAARPAVSLPAAEVSMLFQHLDGLPLAIELAAARVRSMTVQEILQRLDDRFVLLTVGDRAAPRRHQTLSAVIDWSWNLLEAPEQQLLGRLSVFADGFSAGGARAVAGGGHDIEDGLGALVEQSLVTVSEESRTGELRYRLLETVREFAAHALDSAGERGLVQQALASWGVSYCRDMLPALDSGDQRRAFAGFAVEQENLVAILREALDRRDAPVILTLYGVMGYFWTMSGANSDLFPFGAAVEHATVGYRATPETLDVVVLSDLLAATGFPFGERRAALLAMGRLRHTLAMATPSMPRIAAASRLLVAALQGMDAGRAQLARLVSSPDPAVKALALLLTSHLAENDGHTSRALPGLLQAHDLAVSDGHLWSQASTAQSIASLHVQLGYPERSLDWIERARAGQRALRAHPDLDQLDWLEAMARLSGGDYEVAARIFDGMNTEESTPGFGAGGRQGMGLSGLAEVELALGQTELGLAHYRQALQTQGPGEYDPWYQILAAGAVLAHMRVAETDESWSLPTVRRLRSGILARHRVQGASIDVPVSGSGLMAIAAWLLRPTGPGLLPERQFDGLDLLALATRIGVQQTLPSLNVRTFSEHIAGRFGAGALEAARLRVDGLDLQEALDRALTLLRQDTVRSALQEHRPGD